MTRRERKLHIKGVPRRVATSGAHARRRRVAAAVFLLAIPVGIVAAVAPSPQAIWVMVGAAGLSSLVLLSASPSGGGASPTWRLMGLGMGLWAGGLAGLASAYGDDLSLAPLPSATDAALIGGLACIAGAIALMAHNRTAVTDWIARVDAMVVGLGVVIVYSVFLWPLLRDAEETAEGVGVAIAVSAVTAALVAATARFSFTRAPWLASGRFIIEGTLLLVVGSMSLRAAQLRLDEVVLKDLGSGFVAAGAIVMAAAAVHPSASRIADRERSTTRDLPPARLALLAVAASTAPISAIVQQLRGTTVDGVLLGGLALALIALVAARLQLMVRGSAVIAAREAVIRDAAVALSTAHDAAAIRRAVLDACGLIVGEGLRYLAWIVVNDRGATSPIDVIGPDGPMARDVSGIDIALEDLDGVGDDPVRVLDGRRQEVIFVAVPCRVAGRAGIATAISGRVSEEVDESLAVLGHQAALALDALVQAEELHEKRSEARFQQLVRHSSDAVMIVSRDGRIRYQTPSVVRVLGYLVVDLDGAAFNRILHPDALGHVGSFLEQLVHSAPETVRTVDGDLVRADDSVIHAEIVGVQLLENPDVGGVVLTIRDVTGRRTLEDQLRHQAFHDPLTGLSNRALFLDRVEHALARIRRLDSITPAVAFIDLDDFKMVNDSLGHAAGDEMLHAVADRLRACLRSGDTPARLGGDEFAVLLEDAPDVGAVVEVAERILDALHAPIRVSGGREVYARASIGIATRLGPAMTSDELLRNADLAMYAAKANGKSCIEVFEPTMHLRAVDRLAIRGELERAVERDELDVAYQPIVRLVGREVVGFEALARWYHPERGSISPVEFVPIAEDTGLIVALGNRILERACRQLAVWLAANPHASWHMSVNLSARQLLAPDLLASVRRATESAGIDPSMLVLELTETALLADSERVLHRLDRLKDLGVQIAIDDFGTGYSSLSYLQRVPFDILKIDRAFVATLRHEEPSSTLVRTIMDLGRTLSRGTVAEGIEEQIELDGLLELGCELGQGLLFGGAVDARTLERDLGLLHASA